MAQDKELRMILVGSVKSGKSSTGNAILGSQVFETKLSGNGITKEICKQQADRNNKRIIIVDTPGYFCLGNEDNKESILRHIQMAIALTSPGPHAFVVVFSMLGLSNTDLKMLSNLIEEKRFVDHVVVVFTGRDLLERGKHDFGTFRAELPIPLQQFLIKVGTKKIFAFDNTKSDKEVSKLVDHVEEMSTGTRKHFENTE